MADKLIRCAVYTRKSTEDGLEQEFNSLDAQYEACAAYALSQKHEGWLLVPGRYDDGGFSGGNMDRPGLKRLMADIAAGQIDVILLYKIDRLTRSLADFAKIVEVLDKTGASFVSITQAFNTTTSMGRLTLNMLLSFAQFEREVTGERIRDKIAASKRKGMWMGGPVPLGYDVKDRRLVVNPAEAELVRTIMQRYLELGSVAQLAQDLNAKGYRTKVQRRTSGPHRGGCAFRRGTLYHLLANRIYIGELKHKGEYFDGEHEAIVPRQLWDAVQAKLQANASGSSRRTRAAVPSLLTRLVFDEEGRAMTPSHASKPGKRYRYYVTRPDQVAGTGAGTGAWRVAADDLEQLVCARLAGLFADQHAICELAGVASADHLHQVLAQADLAAAAMRSGSVHQRAELLSSLLQRVILREDGAELLVDRCKLADVLGVEGADHLSGDPLVLPFSARKVRRGHQIRLVIPAPEPVTEAGPVDRRDEKLVALVAQAQEARELVLAEPDRAISGIAARHGRCRTHLAKLVSISCLAPDILAAVLEGTQPRALTARTLMESELPLDWKAQRALLGFGGEEFRSG